MRFAEALQTCKVLLAQRLSVIVSGPPGIGKSALAESLAHQMGWRLVVSHPVIADPVDFKGLPFVVEGRAEFLPFGDLLDLITTSEDTLWHFDDLIQAPIAVQAALMQLVHPNCRQLGGRKLSPHVRILACTNRRQDRAGGTGFIEPLKQRFVAIPLETDHQEWTEWALRNSISPYVAAYLRWRPAHLLDEKPSPDLTGSPNPRGWEWVSRILETGLTGPPLAETLTGVLGHPVATEFLSFLQIAHSLPDLTQIANDPDAVPVPMDPATLYAAVGSLVSLSDQLPHGKVVHYVERLPEEHQVLFATFASSKKAQICSSRPFAEWAVRHQHVFGLRH